MKCEYYMIPDIKYATSQLEKIPYEQMICKNATQELYATYNDN